MARTKISEFSATPANNTDIDSINIAEGCAPSGINDAIRELMAQLKDFQTGAVGDSFNGPVGTTTAAAGAFTTLSASSTVSGTGFSTYLASPPAIGTSTAAAGAFTTLTASSTLNVTGVATLGNGAILGTPASGTVTNLTGTASININGTVGATTASTGAFTTLSASGGITSTGNGDTNAVRLTATTVRPGGFQIVDTDDSESMRVYLSSNSGNGRMIFAVGTGTDPTTVAERMSILTSNGNVGIGTSSPTTKLDVVGSGDGEVRIRASSDSALIFSETTANKNWKLKPSAGDFYWQYSATAYNSGYSALMALTSTGNLGLGVTPSAWGSDTDAIQMGGSTFSALAGNVRTLITANAYYDGTNFKYINTGSAFQYRLSTGTSAHEWYTAPSGTAGNAITFTQAMTLDASGRLGIGTTSPECAVDVFKASSTDDAGRYSIRSFDSTTAALGVGGGIAFTGYYSGTSSAANFATIQGIKENSTSGNFASAMVFTTRANGAGLTERARIDSSGRLLVGTTSSIGTASVGKVQILGGETFITTNSEVGGFVGVNSNADNSVAIVADPDSLRSGSHIAFYVDGFSEKARIDSSGNLGVGVTSNSFRINATVQSGANGDIFAAQISGASNGLTVKWNHATTTTRVNISNLPTSATGLASGDLYVLSGVLMVA